MYDNVLWWACFALLSTAASVLLSVLLFPAFSSSRTLRLRINEEGPESAASGPTPRGTSPIVDPKGFDYEVFLSFRGTDTRKGFTDFLYNSLKDAGVRVFRDDEELRELTSVDEGTYELKHRLRNKKVLILLDDVDRRNQLNALAAELDWFGPGSRIIVTTRNRDVLPQASAAYEVRELQPRQAFLLFCKHAFRNDLPSTEFVDISYNVVETTGGLPLALEVIGSFLAGKRMAVWEDALKKLKRIPRTEVQEKLKISYEALDHEQKQIFLDVACLFIGIDVRIAVHMWEDCEFFPNEGIEVLCLMSLIKIGDDHELWMHDQLRDLGREIVRQENYNEPGKRSRLWRTEEAVDVLERQEGSANVEAIRLNFGIELVDYCFGNEELMNLSNLRFLQLDSANLTGDFRRLLSKLRWLCWLILSSAVQPANLHLKNLVILDLSYSSIREDWSGWISIKMSVKLKVLDLTGCRDLQRTPDFSSFLALERLILEDCRSLAVVDPSIRHLKHLVFLNLRKCLKLKKLPAQLSSMKALTELLIDGSGIKEIPISGAMRKLEILCGRGLTDRGMGFVGKIPSG
ncbi:hypothetical protein CRG98_045884 [Punica granatum]|uniref:TIR domain-containing protein n=1 Tax=Punica granatum TaxID=22663 RepID=A0A2I0HPT9_PUNGR|nr:hypothetical protein CRG98_045884 [Punica granatum]